MSWATAIPTKTLKPKATAPLAPPIVIETAKIDWDRLVSLDFETYYDEQYTLKKLSTSEYVRDERFEALMLGLKVGRKKTRIIPGPKIKAELAKINWKTHSLLAHQVQFDGFILSTHYGIVPAKYYDTLGMVRGLHSNEVSADLDSASIFYGGAGKTESGTEDFKGLRFKDLFADKTKWNNASVYCANDVDEMYRIFTEMVPHYPADEIDLIHMTARMFCDPVLKVDIPRVQAEYDREVAHRKQLMLGSVDLSKYDIKDLLKKKAERELPDEERQMLMVKRVIGSNERFTQLLIDAGVPEDAIPRKVSPAWIKRSPAEKEATLDEKYVYAYAKDDLDFTSLPDRVWDIRTDLDPNDVNDVIKADAMAVRWQQLIDVRISVKSTTNITRAARFLEAGRDGYSLPVGYAYYRAHTGRWGGNNKMNMQNLTRGGELRLSILAAPGHQIAVADSSQIEARTNAWLWDQIDLIAAFRDKRDIYSEFATAVYGRLITKNDKIERHVGKTCVLGLGYQMGAAKLQMTLAKGALGGPKIALPIDECHRIVNLYRRQNYKISAGWQKCAEWIEHMANPNLEPIRYKCLEIGYQYIQLPNGMRLKYPDLRKARGDKGWDEWSYQSGEMRKKIYGGLLCENLVQALARIIVATQMLAIDTKYRVVMTTHDEAVTHPKTKDAAKCFAWMEKCMTTPPAWCADLPVMCEGGYDSCYSK